MQVQYVTSTEIIVMVYKRQLRLPFILDKEVRGEIGDEL